MYGPLPRVPEQTFVEAEQLRCSISCEALFTWDYAFKIIWPNPFTSNQLDSAQDIEHLKGDQKKCLPAE